MVAVLNVVGVDWATFGNHEFDIGDASLRARLTESRFRVVSSNVTDASGALFPQGQGRRRPREHTRRDRRTSDS